MIERPGAEFKQSAWQYRLIALTYITLLIGVVLSIGIYLESIEYLQERSRTAVEFSFVRLSWFVGWSVWVVLPLGIFAAIVRAIRRMFRSTATAIALLLSATTVVGVGLALYVASQSWLGYANFDPKEFLAFMIAPVYRLICVAVLAGVCLFVGWATQRGHAENERINRR